MFVSYFIEGCPIPFHDLLELFEYLVNAGSLLYQYQFLTVYGDGWKPLFWIVIKDNLSAGKYFITYLDYPRW